MKILFCVLIRLSYTLCLIIFIFKFSCWIAFHSSRFRMITLTIMLVTKICLALSFTQKYYTLIFNQNEAINTKLGSLWLWQSILNLMRTKQLYHNRKSHFFDLMEFQCFAIVLSSLPGSNHHCHSKGFYTILYSM